MKKILVVDDDEAILEALQIAIEQEGFSVETLANALEVTKKATTEHWDLILLDMLLSGVNGQDVVRELRKEEKTKKIPIIMFSAHPSAARMAKESGADDFIAKPFDIKELVDKINEHLEKQSQR